MFQRVFLKVVNARVVGNLYRRAGAAPFPAVVIGMRSHLHGHANSLRISVRRNRSYGWMPSHKQSFTIHLGW